MIGHGAAQARDNSRDKACLVSTDRFYYAGGDACAPMSGERGFAAVFT